MNLTTGLVIAAACILAAALIPIFKLIMALPSGVLRKCWCGLASMVVAFIGGYLITARSQPGLLIASIFFFGALFVLLVGILSQGIALDAARIMVLEQENVTDPLMQIYNRRYLDARLRKELRRSQKDGHQLSVLLIDIDHFKRVNDIHGHLSGDAILRQLGPLAKQTVRKSDTVARYGGEEIIVLARDTSSRVASVLAERLCSAIEANEFYSAAESPHGLTELHITASIGVSTLREGDDVAALVQRADEALYRAKNEGRNRVIVSAGQKLAPSFAAVAA